METKLARISQMSAENPDMVFTSLYHPINSEMLRKCHNRMDGTKVVGVDGITKEEYEKNLENNLKNLQERLKSWDIPRVQLVRQSGHWSWRQRRFS